MISKIPFTTGDLLRECRWWLRCRGFLRRHRRLPRGERESPQTKLNQKFTFCPGEALCPSSCGNRLVSNLYDVAFTVFRRPLYKLYLVINFHLFRIQADNGRFIQFEQTTGVIFSSAKLRAI